MGEGLPRVTLCCRDHQLVLRASQYDDQVRSSSRQVHGLLYDVPRRCCAKGCERCHCHHQDQAYHSVRRLVPNRLQVRYIRATIGFALAALADTLDGLNDIHALNNRSEHAVLAIEPVGLDSAQEELGAVGVGTSVGHGEVAGAGVFQCEVFVVEFVAANGHTASAVASGEITALAHEIIEDAVEAGSLVAQGRLSTRYHALLASAESTEVLRSFGDNVGTELHYDAACLLRANGDIEEDLGIAHV